MRNLISVCGCHGTWALQLPNPNLAFSKLTRLKEYRTHQSGGHSEGIHSFIFNIRWWIVRAAYRSCLLCYCGGGAIAPSLWTISTSQEMSHSHLEGSLFFSMPLFSSEFHAFSLFVRFFQFFFSLWQVCYKSAVKFTVTHRYSEEEPITNGGRVAAGGT